MESVFFGRDCELLPQMFSFYAPRASQVRDVTANTRKMWKGTALLLSCPVRFYDIDPAMKPDVVCDWANLPDADRSIDVLVYDPPHLPIASASEKSMKQMGDSYGLRNSTTDSHVAALHPPFLKEAKRVLKPDGLVFAKIKDYVHNHKYQWNLEMFNQAVRDVGMTPCDLIIKRDPAGGNLKSGRWVKSHHARNCHCYWVVVRNGRCEPKTLPRSAAEVK